MGEWKYSSTTLDLSTRQGQVDSFTLQLLYPGRIEPWYPLNEKWGWAQSWSGKTEGTVNYCKLKNSHFSWCIITIDPHFYLLTMNSAIQTNLNYKAFQECSFLRCGAVWVLWEPRPTRRHVQKTAILQSPEWKPKILYKAFIIYYRKLCKSGMSELKREQKMQL
jgi:hypothetical protein